METQNITLSLPKDILLRAKLLAVQRNTSVSSLLTQALRRMVEQEEQFTYAQRRHLQALERGYDLGTGGVIKVSRDRLHERR
ncbi:MAG: CopG family transcriptional regulator [Chloroflexi bacterium RBG_16_57_11]|nr:MAG: CopG family transcriptional regulator [Chloroflexi bacterium RBG_16_57_11]